MIIHILLMTSRILYANLSIKLTNGRTQDILECYVRVTELIFSVVLLYSGECVQLSSLNRTQQSTTISQTDRSAHMLVTFGWGFLFWFLELSLRVTQKK